MPGGCLQRCLSAGPQRQLPSPSARHPRPSAWTLVRGHLLSRRARYRRGAPVGDGQSRGDCCGELRRGAVRARVHPAQRRSRPALPDHPYRKPALRGRRADPPVGSSACRRPRTIGCASSCAARCPSAARRNCPPVAGSGLRMSPTIWWRSRPFRPADPSRTGQARNPKPGARGYGPSSTLRTIGATVVHGCHAGHVGTSGGAVRGTGGATRPSAILSRVALAPLLVDGFDPKLALASLTPVLRHPQVAPTSSKGSSVPIGRIAPGSSWPRSPRRLPTSKGSAFNSCAGAECTWLHRHGGACATSRGITTSESAPKRWRSLANVSIAPRFARCTEA